MGLSVPGCSHADSACRVDPVFGVKTPLLFAHRGGALEVPQSTREAFDHALRVGADVLEIDVQAAADGEIVVWHGPELDIVRVGGGPVENHIGRVPWSRLRGQAWVRHPRRCEERDLACVPQRDDRLMLSLSDFLDHYTKAPLNIEMKETFRTPHVAKLARLLRERAGKRPILVVSASWRLLRELRRCEAPVALGLSGVEALATAARAYLPFAPLPDVRGRALQIPHGLTSARIVRAVRERGGATHCFLTGFGLLTAIDADRGHPTEAELFPILERGVDGVMTDRPEHVRSILDSWAQRTPGGAADG